MIKQRTVVLVKVCNDWKRFFSLIWKEFFMMMICLCQLNNFLSIQIANNCTWKVVLSGVHCYSLYERKKEYQNLPMYLSTETVFISF